MMDNRIKLYFHCQKCLHEMPSGQSPESWSRLSVGWTETGLQVWCVRHDVNVANFDMMPVKEPLQ